MVIWWERGGLFPHVGGCFVAMTKRSPVHSPASFSELQRARLVRTSGIFRQ
jgi:hypothetical protein